MIRRMSRTTGRTGGAKRKMPRITGAPTGRAKRTTALRRAGGTMRR